MQSHIRKKKLKYRKFEKKKNEKVRKSPPLFPCNEKTDNRNIGRGQSHKRLPRGKKKKNNVKIIQQNRTAPETQWKIYRDHHLSDELVDSLLLEEELLDVLSDEVPVSLGDSL